MQHGGDYASYYAVRQYPPPAHPSSGEFPPPDPIPPSYASAPPYSSDFPPAVYPPSTPASAAAPVAGTNSYAPPAYNQKSEPSPYSQLPQQSQFPSQAPQFPAFPTYNSSSYPSEQSPAAAYPPTHPQQGLPPTPYYPYDPNQQQPANYAPQAEPNGIPNQNSSFSTSYSLYDAPYGGSSAGRYDQGADYFSDDPARYGSSAPDGGYAHSSSLGYERDFYEKKPASETDYDQFGLQDEGIGDGVYAYDGGRSEPYGARGTVPTRSQALFDDYGRSLSFPSGAGKDQGGSLGKIVRAVPKVDVQQDVKNSVQKFRVKLLSEGGGQSTMDVLCQIGLDGIRILDPSTSRTLRIYPLEAVTRWEVTDSSTFTFWSKSSVDIDPRRIRLQSNSYTTSTILDTVTAATVQFKEMGGKESLVRGRGSSDAGKQSEQSAEKKKGFIDWMNLIKPANEEKQHWVPDEAVSKCTPCGSDFGPFNRRHHCRNCGDIFCDKCTQGRIALTEEENAQPVRVCDRCMAEVTQRLSSAKEAAGKQAGLHSHEDLARKLQEEMDKNRKSSSVGSKSSDGSGRRMREVACPICTVHLQVQVPASGSETVECGVCQHPFLVGAY